MGVGPHLPVGVSAEAVRSELNRILAADGFARAERLSRFLRFTVEQALQGCGEKLKEYLLGLEVFDRGQSFDPRCDTIVRVEARRLRSALIEYYAGPGRNDALRIDVPKGAYLPVFRLRPAGEISTIVVLPFVNMSTDTANECFSDGLTEELTNALAKVEGLRVVARSSAFQFKGGAYDVREIGKWLNANAVLEGSVRKEGDRLRVTVQLNSTADGCHVWSETFDRQIGHVFSLQEEISGAIVQTLRTHTGRDLGRGPVRRHTENVESYNLYLKGRYCWNKRTEPWVRKAIDCFNVALEKDPNYALAYAGLADCYNALAFSFDAGALPPREAIPQAEAAVLKALTIDDQLAEAHISLAFIRFLYDWDWPRAGIQFRKALDLNPQYAHAHHWHSHYLMALGRAEESLQASRRALELEPLDSIIRTHLGWHFIYAHEYDEAIEHLGRALELDPYYFHAQRELGRAYAMKGMYDRALAAFRKALWLSPGDGFALSALGHACGLAGRRSEAHNALDELNRLSRQRYISPYFKAAIYVGLADRDQAFLWLERAYQERADALVYLKREPMFEPLYPDRRFAALLARMGL